MGVLNVTPDSFSDGGRFLDPGAAVRHGLEMWSAGADLVDVGGESTRPGSDAVDATDELARVLPVVEALTGAGVAVSIDTSKAVVAAAALAAGAVVVNDVTALADPEMAGVVATHRAGLVLLHMRGTPRTMQTDPRYDDVVGEVVDFLQGRRDAALAAGVAAEAICLDPGIGFGKALTHNLDLLATGVSALVDTGHPVLVGASRKSFLEAVLGPIPTDDRDAPTLAAHTLAIAGGATMLRTHNVVAGLRSARIADAIVRGSS